MAFYGVPTKRDFKIQISTMVQANRVKDAKQYGSAIVEEVLEVTGEKKPDSVAKRDMTPGKISRIIEKLEGGEET